MFAGTGLDLGAVSAHGTDLFEAGTFLGHEQYLHENLLEELAILAAEGADGVVIGIQVAAADVADHHILAGCVLDHTRGEPPSGIAINEQGKHHLGWILFVARPPLIDEKVFRRELVNCVDQEMRDVIVPYPVAQIGRQ